MANGSDALGEALQHLEARRLPDALQLMLEAWSECRDASLADCIDELDAAVARSRPPLPLGGSNKQRAWLAACDAAGPLDRSRLYETITESTPGAAAARVLRLAKLPPDPRLARNLWAYLKNVPYPGKAARSFYQHVAAQLIALEDRRFDEDIVTTSQSDHTSGYYTVNRLKGVGSRTALKAFRELVTEVEAREPLAVDEATRKQIAQLVEQVPRAAAAGSGEDTMAALLAAVYDAPDDDAPRLVYADLLQQRGDPRGEFIMLQCLRGPDDPPSRRERSLLKKYGDGWLEGLGDFLLKGGRTFRRGFLSACRYHHGRLDPNPVGVPAWATVEELDCSAHVYTSGSADIIMQPHVRALRTVRGITESDLAAICGCPRSLALESIHLRRGTARGVRAALKGCTSLPRLRVLDLTHCSIAGADLVKLRAAVPAGVTIEPSN